MSSTETYLDYLEYKNMCYVLHEEPMTYRFFFLIRGVMEAIRGQA